MTVDGWWATTPVGTGRRVIAVLRDIVLRGATDVDEQITRLPVADNDREPRWAACL
jgi:hypothetical protein